jgi:Manganese containing catalase
MYHHVKQLMYTVRVGEPDPQSGRILLEQFGGANGELAAAMQYTIQGLNCEDPARKDLLFLTENRFYTCRIAQVVIRIWFRIAILTNRGVKRT